MADWKELVYEAFDVALEKCPKDFGSGFRSFLAKFLDELKNPLLDDNVLKSFTQVQAGCDITSVLLDSPVLRPMLTLHAENPAYDDSAAETLRESGNAHFKRSRYKEALKAYSNSILRCQRELRGDHVISKCLPLSYANRSAVLYQLGELRECLADIDAAIAAGYPADMLHKLHERKVRCLLRLNEHRAAEKALTAARESLSTATLTEKEKQVVSKLLDSHAHSCVTTAATALSDAVTHSGVEGNNGNRYPSAPPLSHGANDKYTALSAAVDVFENDSYGKHVVCKRRVEVGDILAVDEPFVAVPLPTSLTTHCYFCLQRFGAAFYPCRRCSVALYCSQECESRSWSTYHRYECYKMLDLTGCGHHMGHLSLRATLVAGLIHHTSHTPDGATSHQSAAKSQGCSQCPTDYSNLLRQGIPTEAYALPTAVSLAILAVYLALCTNPDVAELIPSGAMAGKSFLHHVAAITFTHLAAFLNRVHHIYETILNSTGGDPARTAWAIYPVLNLFNHSCDSTIYRTYHGKKVAMHSLRPLVPGEQIFDTYGPNYLIMARHERRLRLKCFGFHCSCAACEGDWPTKDVLKRRFESEMVPPCVHRVGRSAGESRCLSCLVRFQSIIMNSCGLAVGPESGRDPAIIKALMTALGELHRIAVPPHYLFVHCKDKLTFCFDLTGNLHTMA